MASKSKPKPKSQKKLVEKKPAREKKPQLTDREVAAKLLSAAELPEHYSTSEIEEARRILKRGSAACPHCGASVKIPDPPTKWEQGPKTKRWKGLLECANEKCGKILRLPAAVWAPSSAFFLTFDGTGRPDHKPRKPRTLDWCRVSKVSDLCEHKLPTWNRELGWPPPSGGGDGGSKPPKRKRAAKRTAPAPAPAPISPPAPASPENPEGGRGTSPSGVARHPRNAVRRGQARRSRAIKRGTRGTHRNAA